MIEIFLSLCQCEEQGPSHDPQDLIRLQTSLTLAGLTRPWDGKQCPLVCFRPGNYGNFANFIELQRSGLISATRCITDLKSNDPNLFPIPQEMCVIRSNEDRICISICYTGMAAQKGNEHQEPDSRLRTLVLKGCTRDWRRVNVQSTQHDPLSAHPLWYDSVPPVYTRALSVFFLALPIEGCPVDENLN